jgi:N-acylneuraminate cytidylyltransferase
VEKAIKMMERTSATGLRSIHEMSESSYKCFQLRPGNILEPLPLKWSHVFSDVDGANMPNQFYPPTYHPNGVVDIMRPNIIKDGGTFGKQVMGYVTAPTIEIDTKNDLELARYQFAIKYQGKMEAFTNA